MFREILVGTHADVLFLTATLFIYWFLNDESKSDLTVQSASELLSGHLFEPDERPQAATPFDFVSILKSIARIQIGGPRFSEDTYGTFLDSLVSELDQITEPKKVPGRVYSVSTLHGRYELIPASLPLLLARASEPENKRGLAFVKNIAESVESLPDDDHSLRDFLETLRRLERELKLDRPRIHVAVQHLAPDVNPSTQVSLLTQFLESALKIIEDKRSKRLDALPVDPTKIQALRCATENEITEAPAGISFFTGFRILKSENRDADVRTFRITGINKGELTDPPMEPQSVNFEEAMVSYVADHLSRTVVASFLQRPREQIRISASIDESAFWRIVSEEARKVGDLPTLVVSTRDHWSSLNRFLFGTQDRPDGLVVEHRDDVALGSYLATVEGINVFSAQIQRGHAWLFSARILDSVEYGPVGATNEYLVVEFEPDDDGITGALSFKYRQIAHWRDLPNVEIHLPTANAE